MNLVLRRVKGSRLTHEEMDGNWEFFDDKVEISITDFGGAPDNGTTDNLAAFNLAKAALPSTGGKIKFPGSTGKYYTSAALQPGIGTTLTGDGRGASIIKSTNTSGGHVISISQDRCAVENIGLEGTAGGGDGISIEANVGFFNADKVRITSTDRGVVLVNGNYVMKFRDSDVISSRRQGWFMTNSATVHNVVGLDNCTAVGCGTTGSYSGFKLDNSTACVLVHCACDSASDAGFEISSGRYTLLNCTAEINTVRGFAVTASGLIQIMGCRTFNQLLPFSVNGPASTMLYGIESSGTPSGNSLELGSAATGANFLGPVIFDRSTSVDSAATLISLTSTVLASTGKGLFGSRSDPGAGYMLSARQDVAGTSTSSTIRNLDNTNGSSHAIQEILVGGASGGDAKTIYAISGVVSWALGIDNSAGDVFTLGSSGALGTNVKLQVDSNGNFAIGATSAIATNAADGFVYVPTCAGTPTGTPTGFSGRAPIVIDTTNNKIYFYSNGAWRDAGP